MRYIKQNQMETNEAMDIKIGVGVDFDAVVLANGEYPTHAFALRWLEQAPYVICCDGAANEYLRRGFIPDAIIGDGDSITPENRERFASRFHPVTDQETNDQTKAIHFLRAQGKRRILIVGATGRREDHTLGNISLLVDYRQSGIDVRMATDYGLFTPVQGDYTFASHPGQQVSIFSFGAQGLQAEGLVYPLSDFTHWWQGTLNEAIGAEFTIRAKGDYLVFQAYEGFVCYPRSRRVP